MNTESVVLHDATIHHILASGGAFDDLLHRPLLEATRQLATGFSVSDALRQQVVDEICQLWLDPPFWQLREIIESIWMGSTDEKFIQLLVSRLTAFRGKIVEEEREIPFARLLYSLGQTIEARAILLEVINRDYKVVNRDYDAVTEESLEAATALAEMGDPDATAILLKFATDRKFGSSNQCNALTALSQTALNQPDERDKGVSNDNLIAAMRDITADTSNKGSVRCAAALIIGKLGECEEALSLLRELAGGDDANDVGQHKAAEGLAQFGAREEAISRLRQLAVEEKHHAICNYIAAKALARLSDSEAVNLLVAIGRSDRPCAICGEKSCIMGRESAATYLGELGEREKAHSVLWDIANAAEQNARAQVDALTGLGRLGYAQEITARLLQLTKAPGTYVRRDAFSALGKWGERRDEVKRTLLTSARDEQLDVWERCAVIEALGHFGQKDKEVLECLADIARNLTNQEWMGLALRSAASFALWSLVQEE